MAGIRFVNLRFVHFNHQLPPGRHGIPSVHHHVHNHLFELSRIRANVHRPGLGRYLQLDILPQNAFEQSSNAVHVFDDVDHLGLENFLPAECQQLPCE